MLRVLIIDDDLFTRKGLQTMMPWEKHGMEIVGEASDGKSALHFLEQHPVDLALVDLDMPIMDGSTFIRQASSLYPDLNYVVLTMHTEFEYVQDILRLGAIDYIAKMQFDKENFDEILDRIQANIAKKVAMRQPVSSIKWREAKVLYPDIFVLISPDAEQEGALSYFMRENELENRKDVYELLPGVWVFSDSRTSFQFPEDFSHMMLLRVSDVGNLTYQQLTKLLKKYLDEQFFYDYKPVRMVNHKRIFELQESFPIKAIKPWEELQSDWLSFKWIYEEERFVQLKRELADQRLSSAALYQFLIKLQNAWNKLFSHQTGETLDLPTAFFCWTDLEQWLDAAYQQATAFRIFGAYSEEVVKSIIEAKAYIGTHYASPIDAKNLAKSANMSTGYFSRCFHEIIGETFSDYCIHVRMERAKEALKNPGLSIQQVALSVGYDDEKYFSRSFKKITGLSPTDYRKEIVGRQ